jgi:hypothetical protein
MQHQLVGQKCVFCDNAVESVVEGRFCKSCGVPYHIACCSPLSDSSIGVCTPCASKASSTGGLKAAPNTSIVIGVQGSIQRTRLSRRARWIWVIGVCACIVIAGWFFFGPKFRFARGGVIGSVEKPRTSEQLFAEYQQGPNVLDNRYAGMYVIFRGKIINTGGWADLENKRIMEIVLASESDNTELVWVTCRPQEDEFDKFVPLVMYDVITVKGFCDRADGKFVDLRDCKLLQRVQRQTGK